MRRYLWLALLSVFSLGGCGEDEVIRFGAILPLTGPYELYGQSIRKGVECAIDAIEAREDYPYEISVTIVDSEGEPEKAREQLKQFLADGIFAAIGGYMYMEVRKARMREEKPDVADE